MKKVFIILISLCLLGCTPSIQQTAYNTIVAAKAFLDSEKAAHPECNEVGNNSTLCQDLQKATAAKDLLIDATEAYCQLNSNSDPVASCNPPTKGTPVYTAALGVLQNALNNYNQIAADVKGVK